MNLNLRSFKRVEDLLGVASERNVSSFPIEKGGRFVDCGIENRGGLQVGLELSRICLADLADVMIVPGEVDGRPLPFVQVVTDHPVKACLASQYAGWAISEGKYFAMGSGPMRAANGSEALYETIGYREDAELVVGVLETRKPPTTAVMAKIAAACRVHPSALTLLVAPTASLAGTLQVVARSVETAMHKLHELKFNLKNVLSAQGVAPLPPVAKHDLEAIGRTNDAILYGARVVLYVKGSDEAIEAIGSKIPSNSSKDHGEPFLSIFNRYNNDFYAVDPHLFSPAEVTIHNLDTGKVHAFGAVEPKILSRSFFAS